MPTSAAARRYARALFSLAKEDHRVREIGDELNFLASLFDENASLRDALLTPLHPVAERRAVLQAIAAQGEMSGVVRNFVSYLVDQRRLIDYAGIREEYLRLADEEAGLLNAEIIAASPLDDRRKDRLRRALSEHTGREVQLDIRVDPELIGGAIAKVGGMVFDGSIRAQLDKLRASLTKGS